MARWHPVPRRTSAWALCALLCSWACTRKGEPSPEYAEARAEFNALYGRLLEDAYVSPEIAPIEEKLESVPEASEDYPRAQELLRRIESGRERIEARRAEREAAMSSETSPSDESAERGGEPGSAKANAADAGAGNQPSAGMPLAEFRSRFGMCFEPGTEIEVIGKGNRPTFVLRNMALCRERHPGFDRRTVIAEGDRLLAIAEHKDLEIVGADGGVPRSNADAGK